MGPSPSESEPSLPSLSSAIEETLVGDLGVRPPSERRLGRGDQVGRYLLLDPLGRGAMGKVLRAYDPDLDRQVAIKILDERGDPGSRDRLLGEAKAMARIHHPNVITVHDAGMHEGSVFIAMEIVDGPSLDRWLTTEPRSRAEILDVLTDAARGLAAAHAAGVIHRDFKPANVLVTADGRAKVGDFGLAGIEDPVTGPSAETTHAIGTPAYMSPEHFAGVGIDARSDQFSFAIALHEALYGRRPFTATAWPELVAQVTEGVISPELAARRGGIDGVVRRALGVDPSQRFESMEALIAALERARRPVWRGWATAGAVVVALGLVIAGQEREEVEACEPGAQRVEAMWNGPAKAALRIGGSDYTEAFARHARTRFGDALDGYAAAWSTAHDESCALVGSRAQAGTPAQRHTAECLENRLDSLQGLVELATTEPVDAGRVGELVGTLPSIEDCAQGGRWVPYPADPEAAARAAELHRQLTRVRRARLNDASAQVIDDARRVVEQARELDEPYLLALALSQQARVLEATEDVSPLLDEALELALAGGHDRLAAQIVNDVLLASWSKDMTASWQEVGHLVAMARGLLERAGGDELLLGNLSLNEATMLRRAGHLEPALRLVREASAHYAQVENRDGAARAGLNEAITLFDLGRHEEAMPRARTAVAELEAVGGASSPDALQGHYALTMLLMRSNRLHEAFEVASAAYQRARELYAAESYTLRNMLALYAASAMDVGELELARQALASLRAIPGVTGRDAAEVELLELGLLQAEGRHDEVLRTALAVRAKLEPELDAMVWLELMRAQTLFVLGRPAAAQEALAAPAIPRGLALPDPSGQLHTSVAMVGALVGATPPSGANWRSWLPPEASEPRGTLMREVVDVLEAPGDPAPALRRIRAAVAAIEHERAILVQVLDAWLAAHAREPPPAAAPASR